MTASTPFFSICVPQYNRTRHLIAACEVLARQQFQDFEVCISDDCSNDGSTPDLLRFLNEAKLRYVYERQPANVRYDANVRKAIGMARGRYCFLHGNDDCLAGSDILGRIHAELLRHAFPEVAVTNFEDWATGAATRRVLSTGVVGAGPTVAASTFRNVAFVSGVLVDRAVAQGLSSERWDGSEMYQMYVAARAIASGKRLLNLDIVAVRKDIRIEGEVVDSYAANAHREEGGWKERRLPMRQLGQLVADAISPYAGHAASSLYSLIFAQLYRFTYPFWMLEYRRIHSWSYAAGLAYALRPSAVLGPLRLKLGHRVRVYCSYAVTLAALVAPQRLAAWARPWIYRLAKR